MKIALPAWKLVPMPSTAWAIGFGATRTAGNSISPTMVA
jgi:hypothetical protein